ncbi:MAG: hypothetical protein M1834_005579 [Cirrosporium novae-zelandiae]|nr:MAG: hypothetical protein M1834_005579 [Cirrosporium novae-zelandiae]
MTEAPENVGRRAQRGGRRHSVPHTSPRQRDEHENSSAQKQKQQRRATKERQRVSRACDICKRKKSRCSGTYPCVSCVDSGLTCEFNAQYNRGRLPPTPPANPAGDLSSRPSSHPDSGYINDECSQQETIEDNEDHSQTPTTTEAPGEDASLLPDPEDSSLYQPQESSTGLESRNSPEPSHTDLQGHYVGSSSGISFLIRAQRRLRRNLSLPSELNQVSSSSIFTFGDVPLPDFDIASFILPSKQEAWTFIARYFDFGMPTYRFLHRPTIESWTNQFYDDPQNALQDDGVRGKNAVLFMVFAIASNRDSEKGDQGARYFQAAERQLGAEKGRTRLESVQARLCQCFYLLSHSNVNHCWSLFGTTSRLIQALGLHRKRPPVTDQTNAGMAGNFVDQESRKRVFWCAYILDRYLSSILGRPCTFHDEDLDQVLPEAIDDSDFTATSFFRSNKLQCQTLACIQHIKLGRIVSKILKSLYGLRVVREPSRIELVTAYTRELDEWKTSLPPFLDPSRVDPALLLPIFQRQSTMLSFALSHARILVHRPFLLREDRQHGQSPSDLVIQRFRRECVDAASTVVDMVDTLMERKQVTRAFWFTQYVTFSAVVVLYVYSIQYCSQDGVQRMRYFDAANKCANHLKSLATKHSLAQRYVVVIEALRLEAMSILPNNEQSFGKEVEGNRTSGNKSEMAIPMHQESIQHKSPHLGAEQRITPESMNLAINMETSLINQEFSSHAQYEEGNWDALLDGNGSSILSPDGIVQGAGWTDFDSLVMGQLDDIGYLESFTS